MTKAILRKDWYETVWLGWDKNPSEVEEKYGTHPFGGGHTELFMGQHPEVMKNSSYYMNFIDKYKLKINMSVAPHEIPNFVNVSIKNNDIFDIKKSVGEQKPYIVFIEDVLEHISFNAIGEMLVKIYDQMEIGGEVVIKTLNLQEVLKRFIEGHLQYVDFVKLMYGEQVEANDYHSIIYDENAIKALLDDVGFANITIDKIENGLYLYAVGKKSKNY